jgi:hypothetical protein
LVLPFDKLRVNGIFRTIQNSEIQYLCAWILAPLLFFSLSRNILEAYALPALPAFAILMSQSLMLFYERNAKWRWSFVLGLGMPITAIAIALFFMPALDTQSQKHLLQHWKPDTPLVYVEDLPLSAIFYSHGTAKLVKTWDPLSQTSQQMTTVMPSFVFEKIPQTHLLGWHLVEQYAGYVMLQN